MNFTPLPDDWPAERETLRRIGTHVVARAEAAVTGHFALMPTAGGFGTPQFGPDRRRVRVVGGSLFVETVAGERDGESAATTDVITIAGSTVRELCTAAGCDVDAEFFVGNDTPELGDPDAPISLDGAASDAVGDWYALGQRAIDLAVASVPDAAASVARLWPEHFDVGTDLAIDGVRQPGARVNLGAAAGDGSHEEPYLYVGPWGPERPGPSEYWNAGFGAVLGFGDLDAADNPLTAALEFYLTGLGYLRASDS